MKTFLEYVAEDMILKHGTQLSRIAVVFPNKRASLFLNEHLLQAAGHPIWSPSYVTISELFRQNSTRTVADPIKLVCDLHRSFTAATGTDESLDHFYSWGELLLSDFDDIDKNMANADHVFANLRDIHELDDISYLSDSQREALKRFFSNFTDDHDTLLKQRFLKLWSHMGDIYHDFNRRLADQNLAYEGSLYREVAERSDLRFEHDTYIFVGFNLVQPVEQSLFAQLKQQGKARFYWDFDHYYMPKGKQSHEAGHYIAQCMAMFPSELDVSRTDIFGRFTAKKSITFISAPTENIQARYAGTWLRELAAGGNAIKADTAVVLCNEQLLPTVVHSLPESVDRVNVTTGYPLVHTPIASLIVQLTNLHTNGYDTSRRRFRRRMVADVMSHPLVSTLSDDERDRLMTFTEPLGHDICRLTEWLCRVVEAIGRSSSETERTQLFQESVFRAYTLLSRLHTLAADGDLLADGSTLQRLMVQIIQSTTIPFHGEPAEGLQVMGVLETRNLDFSHVLLLSASEGNMPRGVSDTSFIPYTLRKAYGLTTIDHKVAIYSYYFHRLLQRADDVTIVYNNSTSDGKHSEMSRFMLQLMVSAPHHIDYRTLQAGQLSTPFSPQAVVKSADVMNRLRERFAPGTLLTPTAINRYMRCQLMFYYNYVLGIAEPKDVVDDGTIDNRTFGDIFHQSAQTIYTRLMERYGQIQAPHLTALLRQKTDIEQAVTEAMAASPYAGSGNDVSGVYLITRDVITQYLKRLVAIDMQLAPFSIVGLEKRVSMPFETPHISTVIGGYIDRLDRITDAYGSEQLRVVDYKTGSYHMRSLADVDAIFAPEGLAAHSDYYLQTMLYAAIVSHDVRAQGLDTAVAPALLFIQHAAAEGYDPTLQLARKPVTDIAAIAEPFMERLRGVVDDMFNPDINFLPTADGDRCRTCPYYNLCR